MGILTCKLILKTTGNSKALSSYPVFSQWKWFWIIVIRILKKHIWLYTCKYTWTYSLFTSDWIWGF